MNKINFTGNLTKDAESRYLASGTAILSFDVAVNIGYGDKQTTTYVKCALFGKRAEGKLGEFLLKGTKVAVSGSFSLDSREYEGKMYTDLKCHIDDVDLIGSKPEGGQQQQQSQQQPPQQQQQQQQDDFEPDSDIPF